MELPLNLSITLDKVPAGAAPETIATIALSCNALGLNHRPLSMNGTKNHAKEFALLFVSQEIWVRATVTSSGESLLL